jgi:hypothetical protein
VFCFQIWQSDDGGILFVMTYKFTSGDAMTYFIRSDTEFQAVMSKTQLIIGKSGNAMKQHH